MSATRGYPGSAPPTTSPLANPLSPAPEQIVACIGSQSITGATFSHWAVVAQKSEGSSKHRLSASEVMKQAMSFLISSDWVLGEATDLNIHVSEGEVRHTFDHLRAQHVLAGHHGAHSQQRALKRFVHDFKLKWEAQTYYDPTYAVTDCGHVQASL